MRWTVSVAVFLLLASAVVAQETTEPEIRNGFRDLTLGMTMDAARDVLGRDPNFRYRGEPDVSLLPGSGQPIIETEGSAFIDRAILQFHEDRLYILTLVLNASRLDYFGVYSEFSTRYGDPDRLDPGQAVWDSGGVRLAVERPLTVKYIDLEVFEGIVEAGAADDSLDTLTRERFLEQL